MKYLLEYSSSTSITLQLSRKNKNIKETTFFMDWLKKIIDLLMNI